MRDPAKSAKTVSVQFRLDNINRMLYNETRDTSTEIRLGIAEDCIFVICYSSGVESIIYQCMTCKHLYKVLDSILTDLEYGCDEKKKWWTWFSHDEETAC